MKVIAVFDIGKTNKKLLLFDERLQVVYMREEKFATTRDEDGDECDDIELIESWIRESITKLIEEESFELAAVNFSSYGASLAFLDEKGDRLTPIYNYLKSVPARIQEELFEAYGGKSEFCRRTASPALGSLLNSGMQILWLAQEHEAVFKKVSTILHLPQYLSYMLSGKVVSESSSIGCHTFLWDFDEGVYHSWLKDKKISLPEPIPNSEAFGVAISGKEVKVGIGIHDSSSSLVPYIRGSREKFLLVSTGTWCINMNPFNHSPLSVDQLEKDCLCYLSIDQTPVKSSRLFMGHIHDVNTKRLTEYFGVAEDQFKKVETDKSLLISYLNQGIERAFFKSPFSENYLDERVDLSVFKDFNEAYHRLMYDLTLLNSESMDLVMGPQDGIDSIYISGGFARNEIFVRLLASFYGEKRVYTSEFDNSSALGAALVLYDEVFNVENPVIDLGLKEWAALS